MNRALAMLDDSYFQNVNTNLASKISPQTIAQRAYRFAGSILGRALRRCFSKKSLFVLSARLHGGRLCYREKVQLARQIIDKDSVFNAWLVYRFKDRSLLIIAGNCAGVYFEGQRIGGDKII